MPGETKYYVGIDIGGTFTDVVLSGPAGTGPFLAKTLTTPRDPVAGVIDGLVSVLAQAGIQPEDVVRAVHATTLATNLILEKRGARVAFVTTAGFGDIFQIGQNTRPDGDIYNALYQRPQPLVPREMVVEVPERVAADGQVLVRLEGTGGDWLAPLRALEPEAIAVSLLHACTNPVHEQQVLAVLRQEFPGAYVVASSDIWPQLGEYERAVATVVSAYVGPTFSSYVRRLSSELDNRSIPARLEIMASSGGVMPAEQIARRAVHSIESGPAAGVIASRHLGQVCGIPGIISFDMGGTTAKASVIRKGEPDITHEFRIGTDVSGAGRAGEIVRIPVVDLAEVGAGGGSIAWVDRGGMLQVGPQSAGADPGPACYGFGGQEPTVTDANVVLGYVSPGNALGGRLTIDPAQSHRVIEDKIARPLGLSVAHAAQAIHDLVNAKMGSAVRMVTIRRGIDPKDYCAVGFGGAGPAHIVRVARQFGIPTVIIPPSPGLRSAFGLLVSDLSFDYIHTRLMGVSSADAEVVESLFADMEAEGRQALQAAGLDEEAFRLSRTVDVRILHQRHTIPVRVSSGVPGRQVIDEADARFREDYFTLFGIKPTEPCQLLNFRVRASGAPDKPPIGRHSPRASAAHEARKGVREAFFEEPGRYVETVIYERALLRAGDSFPGPAIVEEIDASTVCPPGYTVTVDPYLNMRIVNSELPRLGIQPNGRAKNRLRG
jgi:N-methylhydantoinase A